jgi:hypothetical protein
MRTNYEEVKMPFKYGIVIEPTEGKKADCPTCSATGSASRPLSHESLGIPRKTFLICNRQRAEAFSATTVTGPRR